MLPQSSSEGSPALTHRVAAPARARSGSIAAVGSRVNPREAIFPSHRVMFGRSQILPQSSWLVAAVAALTLASGLLNVYSVTSHTVPTRMEQLRHLFPMEFVHFSRSAVLLIGYSLILLSINILRRKRTAWYLALAATFSSAVFHFTKGLDYEQVSVSVLLIAALLATRGLFTVRSRVTSWKEIGTRVAIIAILAFGYGVAGFWLLEPVEFRNNFAWREAMRHAAVYLTLGNDPSIAPHTHYAVWFLQSLGLTSTMVLFYVGYLFFRPAYFAFHVHPLDLHEAQQIVERHGRTGLDFFKAWPDKSFYFSRSRQSFLAYRVGAGFAVVLGDPVGPREEFPTLIQDFSIFCYDNDWPFAFHQTTSELLDFYESVGLQRFKLGDDAVVLLDQFTLEGSRGKPLRGIVNKIERAGYSVTVYEAPLAESVLDEMELVSDSWLSLPGHRERQFTLGKFDKNYLRKTTVLALLDPSGEMQGFLNLIPSFGPGEISLDLMRRRADSINGVMDYLFTKAMLHAKARGYNRFSLGMAPMAGFQPGEAASPEEKAIHLFFKKWNLGFRYRGIRDYKAKFATVWEPRYVIYRNRFDLARLALALRKVSEIPGMRTPPPEDGK
ncbi:MAG: DUF2156 domain-containing protein [Bryobacterales bacterium]|nr:DUF2156 domain-containing protein [Bryobacterales bacterium]